MTFVGKILVIAIMAFALVFLGISTVVFTTATNWKAATAEAKADHGAAQTASQQHVAELENKIKEEANETTAARAKLEVAQQSASVALAEAAENHKETLQIRD